MIMGGEIQGCLNYPRQLRMWYIQQSYFKLVGGTEEPEGHVDLELKEEEEAKLLDKTLLLRKPRLTGS